MLTCRPLNLVDETGSRVGWVEDLEIDTARGLVFLSAYNRKAPQASESAGVFVISTDSFETVENRSVVSVRRLDGVAGPERRPHGIALSEEGLRLHVIERRYDETEKNIIESQVTSYVLQGDEARGITAHPSGQIRHRLICRANDLVEANGALWITVDQSDCDGWGRRLRLITKPSSGRLVVARDPNSVEVLYTSLAFPNGVSFREGQPLFALTRAQSLSQTGIEDISLDFAPDNLTRSGDTVLVAGHPSLFGFFLYRLGLRGVSASVVAEVDGEGRVTELWRDDGRILSGATTALAVGEFTLVAAAFDDHIALCTRKGAA
ncbi:MAG: hypothetical protein AAGF15_11160 [Pseudomonadota bacterium]